MTNFCFLVAVSKFAIDEPVSDITSDWTTGQARVMNSRYSSFRDNPDSATRVRSAPRAPPWPEASSSNLFLRAPILETLSGSENGTGLPSPSTCPATTKVYSPRGGWDSASAIASVIVPRNTLSNFFVRSLQTATSRFPNTTIMSARHASNR